MGLELTHFLSLPPLLPPSENKDLVQVLSPPAEATQCLGFLPRLLVGEVRLPHHILGQRPVGAGIQGDVLKCH